MKELLNKEFEKSWQEAPEKESRPCFEMLQMNYNICIPSPVSPTINQEEPHPETAILDLRVRRRPVTPDCTLNYPSPKHSPLPTEFQMQTCCGRSAFVSEQSDTSNSTAVTGNSSASPMPPTSKHFRPFKIFPSDPLPCINAKCTTIRVRISLRTVQTEYNGPNAFKQQHHSNANMRRVQKQGKKSNDPVYLEKRKKNNEAAKRSRGCPKGQRR
ncbi:hypothetical protein NQ318_006207 [Aromia moschata]|uniref:Uncharacterized protein n=1 Tax=Aromia moschata TaxID=1265417 RepID=A0AAV8YID2_9CUCU|nr:hypothetical protein NQ318_006207 [Aromia moschata]